MLRRSTSSIWPRPELWGERAKRFPYRRKLLNWECDQMMWTPQSDGSIAGRKVIPVRWRCSWLRVRPGAPTVSVALMRQRIHYRNNKHRMMRWH